MFGSPLKAAVLINYDPTAPSRLLSTMRETMEETMAARFWCLSFMRMPHLLQCLLPPNHCYAWSRYKEEQHSRETWLVKQKQNASVLHFRTAEAASMEGQNFKIL
ncbi:hypothetical protein Bca52824_004974 [Brassica carinata]|uniref:Uncharacterized protein n=1 Tax=Brassica carinata TaxID=52824 RepID=A0A8X7WMN5_BRACI|nr:hypothetical protein Bca52824_004974 [Brassica carinata]